jgi:hypothetical protein
MTAAARSFLESLAGVPRPVREAAILERKDLWVFWPLVDVRIIGQGHECWVRVAKDVFAIGNHEEPIRIPLSAPSCQAVADAQDLQLITHALSTTIWRCAVTRLDPLPWGAPYDESMLSIARILVHNDRIEAQRRGRPGLVAGHKKDVVVSERLHAQPTQVAIFGWHEATGKPIQPLSLKHESSYADYSHGLRLVSGDCTIDGEPRRLSDVMTDHDLCGLVSAEGRMTLTRYP